MTKDASKVFSASNTGLNGGNVPFSGHVVILRAEKWRLIIREVQHSGHYTCLVYHTRTSVRQGAFDHTSWNLGPAFAAPEYTSGYFTKLRNFEIKKPRSALDRQSYCVFPRKICLLPMKGDRPGLTSDVMFLIVFGSFSGSFAEDTLKKEKQGFSSSYATDTGLKSGANGKSLFFWKCNRISPSACITTFPFQAHTLNFVMHRKTGKTSFTVVKTGGLKSMPKRDKETYAGKQHNSDFHWKKHQSTMYKKSNCSWGTWVIYEQWARGRGCSGDYLRNWYQWFHCRWVESWGIFYD